jgi:hypothetical protein
LRLRGLVGSAATLGFLGEVAQLVEHTAENRGVAGSIPALATDRLSARRTGFALEGPARPASLLLWTLTRGPTGETGFPP